MKDIKELIDNIEKYKTASLQKCFTSNKNTVAYVLLNDKPRILKWFVPGLQQNMEIEHSVLKKGFSHLSIPTPFEKDTENNVIIMSYITGENICDFLNDPRKIIDEKIKVVSLLADWLMNFHSFFSSENQFHIRGDANLKNFILSRSHIWGVDFEESRIGKPSEDLATLCVSLLTTDPMFTDDKFNLCQIFLETYRKLAHWNINQLNTEISYALLERIQWRPKDEKLLRKYANNIRNKGLYGTRHTF